MVRVGIVGVGFMGMNPSRFPARLPFVWEFRHGSPRG